MLSRQQLLQLGWNDTAVAYAIKSRRLSRITTGVVSTVTGEASWLAHAWAAHLKCGEQSYLTSRSALYLHGFGRPEFPIIIGVPESSPRSGAGWIRVIRQRQRREITIRKALPIAKPHDALLDTIADFTSATEVRNFVADVYQKRAVSLDELNRRIRWRRIHHRQTVIETIDHLRNGQTTPLEIPGVERIVVAHGFPPGQGQVDIGRAGKRQVIDYVFPDFGVAIEFDGRLGHDDARGAFRDMDRDNRAMLTGLRTLRFGMSDVNENACLAAAQLAQALRLGGWTGVPTNCNETCYVNKVSA